MFAGEGGLGFSSDAGFDLSPSDEVGQTAEGVLPVLFLRSILPRIDEQLAIGIDLVGGLLDQSSTDGRVQRFVFTDVESQLSGCRRFIDVLPARTGCTNKLPPQIVFLELRLSGNLDHQAIPRA